MLVYVHRLKKKVKSKEVCCSFVQTHQDRGRESKMEMRDEGETSLVMLMSAMVWLRWLTSELVHLNRLGEPTGCYRMGYKTATHHFP